ncbi:MAG: NUDIX hydrolase [Candidatus Pacebacteria bacterium]|nr:NUDIX hydrolase [Candidatus Paceibacterota bacterium]
MTPAEHALSESIRTHSAGGIVIGDRGAIALVQRKNGDGAWLFPKGHLEAGETDEDTARREIREETGLTDLEYIGDLGTYERPPIDKDGSYRVDEVKEIHMYLFAAPPSAALAPEMTEEIGAARWFPYRELAEHIGDDKDRVWYASVFDRVREAIQRD